jgi:hypothetical protein
LQGKIADQTKLAIVSGDNANVGVGFYLSKYYSHQIVGSWPAPNAYKDVSDSSPGGFIYHSNTNITAIVHVTLMNNLLHKKEEFDVNYALFEPPPPADFSHDNFLSKLSDKVAAETLKRISAMTK